MDSFNLVHDWVINSPDAPPVQVDDRIKICGGVRPAFNKFVNGWIVVPSGNVFIKYASHHSIEPVQKDSLLCLYRIQEVRCDLTVIDSFHSIYKSVPLGGIFLICGQIGHLVRNIERIYSSLFRKGRKVYKLFAPIGKPKVHIVGNVSSHTKFRVRMPET